MGFPRVTFEKTPFNFHYTKINGIQWDYFNGNQCENLPRENLLDFDYRRGIFDKLTVRVRDCFLIVFCKSRLFLLATSSESSSSVIWIWSFFLMRWTSVFSLVSASTTRALNCSISMLVCLLEKTKSTIT